MSWTIYATYVSPTSLLPLSFPSFSNIPLLVIPYSQPIQEDILRLVELTEDNKRDRRERIREIEFERSLPRERPRKQLALPWDEEKIYEREVVYEGPRGSRYR